MVNRRRFAQTKKWLRKSYLEVALMLALLGNVINLTPVLSSSLKSGKNDFQIQIF
jgi:hypothetical protein